MKLTKDDFDFITTLISLNKKRITTLDFNNLKSSQIQYKFNKINLLLEITNKKIIKKRFSNFYIHNFSDLEELISNFDFTFLNKTQRLNIIMKKLLVENYINVHDLEKFFSQSNSSIKKDLKELKERAKENSVELIYKSKLGFILNGDENNIRFFFLNYFLNDFDFFENHIKIKEAEYLVFNMLRKKNSPFETSKIISIMLSIQYYRVKNKEILIKLKDSLFIISEPSNYKLKTYYKFTDCLTKNLGSHFEKKSMLFILSVLCYSRSNPVILKKEETFQSILISLLEGIGTEYQLPLSKDEYLIKTLGSHIKSVFFKISNGIYTQKPYLKDIVTEYSKLFSLLKKECNIFKTYFNIKLNDDEIIFILFHIKSSILRLEKAKIHKQNVLLVCNLGGGATKLLSNQLSTIFSLNIIDEISFYQFQVYPLDNIDVIIHTVNFFKSNVKSIKVNLLLTTKDIQTLEQIGFTKL